MTDRHRNEIYREIYRRLGEVYTPAGADTWISARQPWFNGRTVAEMVDAGRQDEVLAVIDMLAEGAAS